MLYHLVESSNTNSKQNDPEVTQTNGSSADLWAHEWNKHGTCLSTLYPECYDDYQHGQEMVDYFDISIRMSRELPTFQFLEACGIVPSNDTTYFFSDIQQCLARHTGGEGYTPHVRCSERGELNEVWYQFYWTGSLRGGERTWAHTKTETNCPDTGIKYPPQEGSRYA